jgi:hypothetical protein
MNAVADVVIHLLFHINVTYLENVNKSVFKILIVLLPIFLIKITINTYHNLAVVLDYAPTV